MLIRQDGRIAILAPGAPLPHSPLAHLIVPSLLGVWLALMCVILPSAIAAGELAPSIERRIVPRRATGPPADQPKREESASAYWDMIAQTRHQRAAKRRNGEPVSLEDYVLMQPPPHVRSIIIEPPLPEAPLTPPGPTEQKYISVVADFLKSAQDYFGFVPRRPRSKIDFKRAYAQAAKAAGITKDQAVRIYGFESGGNGTYDAQAGLEYGSPTAQAISPAIGYDQLLNTNSVELLAEDGEEFVTALRAKAKNAKADAKRALEGKIAVLRHMIEFCRSVPDQWAEHNLLAKTPKGWGVHALNLDVDIGPLLQARKLRTSIEFARRKGYQSVLTAAELEMMNLTGDGNGFDMVTMPPALREQVPTANFFEQKGYERNPVAIRNNVVAKLIAATNAKMDKEVTLPGARKLAAAF